MAGGKRGRALSPPLIRIRPRAAAWTQGRETCERALEHEEMLASMDCQSMITLRKVRISELATAIVSNGLRIRGLAGSRNDSEFSIGWHLRDIMSSATPEAP